MPFIYTPQRAELAVVARLHDMARRLHAATVTNPRIETVEAIAATGHGCPAPSEQRLVAALGILSFGPNADLRQEIRSSWLGSSERSIVCRFVLRGLDAMPAELREASASRDVVFVPELRSHGRKRGPLVSLFAWWRCAVRAWPRAHFVGKADDDVYVHLAGVAAHLRASLDAVLGATRTRTLTRTRTRTRTITLTRTRTRCAPPSATSHVSCGARWRGTTGTQP